MINLVSRYNQRKLTRLNVEISELEDVTYSRKYSLSQTRFPPSHPAYKCVSEALESELSKLNLLKSQRSELANKLNPLLK